MTKRRIKNRDQVVKEARERSDKAILRQFRALKTRFDFTPGPGEPQEELRRLCEEKPKYVPVCGKLPK